MALPSFDTITNFFLGSALNGVNNNFNKVREALNKTILKDGSQPMSANLDMNSNKLINLAPATTDNQAVTLSQLRGALSGITTIDIIKLENDEGVWDPTNSINTTEGLWNA